jgi:hypothetical protein
MDMRLPGDDPLRNACLRGIVYTIAQGAGVGLQKIITLTIR